MVFPKQRGLYLSYYSCVESHLRQEQSYGCNLCMAIHAGMMQKPGLASGQSAGEGVAWRGNEAFTYA